MIFDRIRRRKVTQWTLAYLAIAITTIQIVDVLAGQFGVSTIVPRGVTVLLVTGLFLTVTLAWYHGEKGAQKVTGPETFLLSAITLSGFVTLWLVASSSSAAAFSTSLRNETVGRPGSIAVLPFDRLESGGSSIGDAIQEEILNQLARVPGLEPISRTSVLALRSLGLSSRQIADSLKVRYVIEGSWEPSDDGVKVEAGLIEMHHRDHDWTESRQFENDDSFGLPAEAAAWVTERVLRSVAAEVDPELPEPERHPEAYTAHLDARNALNSRTEEGLRRAIELLERAIRLDSLFAPAFSSLAFAYGTWGTYGYGGPNAEYRSFGRAMALADRAIELDPELGDAYATRGLLLTKAYAPSRVIAADFRRAIALLPASADVRIFHAYFLAREAQFDGALSDAAFAVRLDPLGPGRESGLAWNALAAGNPARALESARAAAAMEPTLMTPRVISALALVALRRPAECLALNLGSYAAVRAICLDAAGQPKAARALADSVAADPPAGAAAQHMATYYAWIGDAEMALAALRAGFAYTPHGLDFRLVQSPMFDRIRDNPAFSDGLARLRAEVWERVRREYDTSDIAPR